MFTLNALVPSLRPCMRRLGFSRTKKTSYYKKKTFRQMDKALHNPKYLEPRKHRKMEVTVVGGNSNPSAAHQEQRRRLSLLGTEYKYDLYSIFQSGRYGSELAAISFAKVTMSNDAQELHVYWQRSGDDVRDAAMGKKLEIVADLVQSDFDDMHPKVALPVLNFRSELSMPMQIEALMEGLDFGEDEDADVPVSSRLPPLVFVQDVYRLNRSAILTKLHSASHTKTSFGVDEKKLE